MTNQELLKRLQALEAAERDVASSMDMPQERTANWEYAETAAIARSAILQQQEGLANYAQENERLRALLTQAPIAKVTVREGCAHYAPDDVSVSLYAPGLPPGEYDLYLMPSVPQSAPQSSNT